MGELQSGCPYREGDVLLAQFHLQLLPPYAVGFRPVVVVLPAPRQGWFVASYMVQQYSSTTGTAVSVDTSNLQRLQPRSLRKAAVRASTVLPRAVRPGEYCTCSELLLGKRQPEDLNVQESG